MIITDEGALLIKVNRHKHNYNGDICAKPNTHECGANQWFRQNNCSTGRGDCFDLKLFHQSDPSVIKNITEEVRSVFDIQIELLSRGLNPIIFFYTNGRRNERVFPIVGAYVVKEITELSGFSHDTLYIYPEKVIQLPLDSLPNEYLYDRSTDVASWCRTVYRSAVVPFLEIMSNRLQEYDIGDSTLLTITDLLEQISAPLQMNPPVQSVHEPSTELQQDRSDEKQGRIKSDFIISDLRDRFDQEVDAIVETAASSGFYYPHTLVANLHNSLQANPFLILSGISGGGKTSFAVFYAKALDAKIEVVSVRPDWTSPSHLLGWYDPFVKNFTPSETTRFINDAWAAYEKEGSGAQPYILLLDEMNLARVEYYFSDFLSKMQLQDPEQRSIVLYEETDGDYPRILRIPPNLRIIGTVNIDETTFLFSPKVLDRATYVFLNRIDIDGMGRVLEYSAQDFHHLKLLTDKILPELKSLNAKLTEMGNPFGYRTVWEIIRWIDSALAVGIIESPYEGLDMQVESRVLSKITGMNNDDIFQGLRTYFQDRIDPSRDGKCVFELSMVRLDTLIERVRREEYALGQQ